MTTRTRPKRIWTYSREQWKPDHRWVPVFASDENGHLTVVLPVPFGGYVVIAYRKCKHNWVRQSPYPVTFCGSCGKEEGEAL